MGLALWGHRRRDHSPPVEERALTSVDLPWMAPPTAAGIAVSPEAALRLPTVLACIRLLAETASTLPLKSYRRSPDGREPFEGRIARLLERPSPGNTQANLITQVVASLAARGNAFIGKFRGESGEVEQLALIPASHVAVELVGGAPVYTVSGAHGVTSHDAADIVHLKLLSTDGITGLSPLGQAREALGLAAATDETASSLFRNQANPKGVLTVAGGPGEDEALENLRAGFSARHGGSRGAGRVAVLTGDVKFTAVSLTPADAELLAQRKYSATETCRLMRVPPHLVAAAQDGASMTYSNVESEGLNFLRFSLEPYLVLLQQALSADRDLCPPAVYCEFVRDALMRPDAATRAAVFEKALNPSTGWMRRDEIRALENLPAEPAAIPSITEESHA